MKPGFLALEIERLVNTKNPLMQISAMINWDRIEWRLNKLDRTGLGPTGYPIRGLLKAVILGQWHSRDAQLEDSLRVRMDFMRLTLNLRQQV